MEIEMLVCSLLLTCCAPASWQLAEISGHYAQDVLIVGYQFVFLFNIRIWERNLHS